MSNFEVISDHSKEKLYNVPENILTMFNLKMLFLEGNFITHLPDDFFDKLTRLTWLDLRNNKLKEFPVGVAHHANLECLFLTNNCLERIPDELGLVPNLKTLQLAGNPLIYPSKEIIGGGTKKVTEYLMKQYYKRSQQFEDEIVLKVIDEEPIIDEKKNKSSTKSTSKHKIEHKIQQEEPFLQAEPELTVKRLSTSQNTNKPEEKDNIVHKIRTGPSGTSILSYYDQLNIKNFQNNIDKQKLKEQWLKKIKVLLENQAKILQQEKNLKTLSFWRYEKQSNSNNSREEDTISSAPFATDENYRKIPSRDELKQQLNTYLNEKTSLTSVVPQNNNLDTLIRDVVKQIKDLECKSKDNASPRAEIEEAEQRIKMFLDIHKKLKWLQANNQVHL